MAATKFSWFPEQIILLYPTINCPVRVKIGVKFGSEFELADGVLQTVHVHVGAALGGQDLAVAQELLYHPEIDLPLDR